MKKAKIVLSAVALFAVVGGALAFKASRFGAGQYFAVTSTSTLPTTTIYYCTTAKTLSTVASGGVFTNIAYASTTLSLGRTVCTGISTINTNVTTVDL